MSIKKEKRINLMKALLESIDSGDTGVAENVAKKFDISKVSVYKYLSELEERGIIARTSRGRYELLREELLYDDAPRFTIIAGVNGTGKSSFSGVMQESDKYLKNIVDVDKISWQLFKENEAKNKTRTKIPAKAAAKTGPEARPLTKADEHRGARLALRMIRGYLERGESFAQETTLAGRSIIKTIKEAKARGYRIRMFYIGVDSAEECKKRIKNRVKKGGHDIPDSDVEHRFNTRREALNRVLPLIDEAEFYDNNNGFKKVELEELLW